MSNLEEIDLRNLAIEKAVNKSVKNFAWMMFTDHTQAYQEMAGKAAKKCFRMPNRVTTTFYIFRYALIFKTR